MGVFPSCVDGDSAASSGQEQSPLQGTRQPPAHENELVHPNAAASARSRQLPTCVRPTGETTYSSLSKKGSGPIHRGSGFPDQLAGCLGTGQGHQVRGARRGAPGTDGDGLLCHCPRDRGGAGQGEHCRAGLGLQMQKGKTGQENPLLLTGPSAARPLRGRTGGQRTRAWERSEAPLSQF